METIAVLLFAVAGLSLIGAFGAVMGDAIGWWEVDNSPLVLMCSFILSAILGLCFAFPVWADREDRLMAACMEDHKEYECVAMLRKRGGGTTVVPMVVPVR